MAEVTVCIPAYSAAGFIHHTLRSVRDQTFRDFEVEIAVEPVDAESTVAACAPFLIDPRFRVVLNPEVLHYAGNVRALFERVRTPYFVALPHDDIWQPRYLELLLGSLVARPDAVCAYSDALCFGRGGPDGGVISHSIDDTDLPGRLLSWYLDGAAGAPWRGVTRSEVLDRAYPTNAFRGFAVECEWALHLISRGVVLRVAEPLYLKRLPTTTESVSASWFWDVEGLPKALDHHNRRLLAAIPDDLSPTDHEAITAAAQAAMLRRWQEFSSGRLPLPSEYLRLATSLLAAADRLPAGIASRITATVKWSLSRHWCVVGDLEAAEREAREGLAAVPDDAMLSTQLGLLLNGGGAVLEAVELGLRAAVAHPHDPGLRTLVRESEHRLEDRLRPLTNPSHDDVGAVAEVTSRAETEALEAEVRHAEARSVALTGELGLVREQMHKLTEEVSQLRQRPSAAETLAPLATAQRSRGIRPPIRRAQQVLVPLSLRARLLNPLFNAAWYRAKYPDVPHSRLLAWLHWRRHGWREGRSPHPFFDAGWYLATYIDVREAGVDPLVHYLAHGSAEGRDPGPDFDAQAYRQRYPDVVEAGLDPLLHYRRYGAAEGRVVTPSVAIYGPNS